MENRKWKIGYLKNGIIHFPLSILHFPASLSLCVLFLLPFLFTACNQIQPPKTEPFYAQKVEPPRVQEFRWSNGKLPKSFDPAKAAAAPETDIVRAIYEGLTDVDSKTLQPIPAIALKWTASEDNKTWTFFLRRDARWSNGESVTAQDFARSWKRLVKLGDQVPQRDLFKNIVGMDTKNALPVFSDTEIDALSKSKEANKFSSEKKNADANSNAAVQPPKTLKENKTETIPVETKDDVFGVEALNDYTLKVSLAQPDADFPALVAHPVFRPVYKNDNFASGGLNADIVTDGAFQIASVGDDGIALERAGFYWNADKIALEKVRFVPMDTAENALAAYRAGEIDAVTNADFEPLALKLLAPYDDFRQTTHSALNFYEFNLGHQPFGDRRVRESLAAAIDRARLTDDEMDGVTEPALRFSPFDEDAKLPQDVAAAQKLLADAGFANGKDFPAIRLLVNRNNVQQRIARAVARMWKKNLNIDTEIIVKDQSDFEAAFQNGEFDIARRGIVLPTADETANMLALFPPKPDADAEATQKKSAAPEVSSDKILTEEHAESNLNFAQNDNPATVLNDSNPPTNNLSKNEPILTEQQALERLPAIPLYFPTSYSLVKPYVQGFDSNALDTPSLKNVTIDSDWQPANQNILSNDGN
ncbi:MAG: peptide ABC transporter substrate-binding protein [Pyrinomonadaceae bacterium]